ncbi:hypothetical protein E2320_014247, partial [Naja naja]
ILAQSKKPILKNKNWFDRHCVQLKRTYNKEYRKRKNAPSEDHTHYLKQLKAQYKTLLKEKKSAARKESWQRLIAAVKTKNTSLFWHITRGLGKSPLPPINQVPIHAWEEYFRELYTDPDYVTKESQISLDQTPYWSLVTPGEISRIGNPSTPINQVPIHAWEEYFRELYTDPDYVTKESQISLDQTPYWS